MTYKYVVEDIQGELSTVDGVPESVYEVVVEDNNEGIMLNVTGLRWDHENNQLIIETDG